ncbi:MAG: hypothetical protein HZT40_11295 [Candidatus Thiothrix singaporensis]|uniref:Uncharacterized protein n=1 Tax=Candidatus Thiothrix singaporensis TaxID=2799669 RepID=A0A7L6ASL0_9GAMM|nr:MAG: hypothetical protein HZT40_11295 [Candidatus Thiothrix singaporensis]
MVLYHPLLTTPDKATQTAALPFLGEADSQTVHQVWQLVKHICEVPLLDAWQTVVMPLLASLEWLQPLRGFGCNATYVKLGSNIAPGQRQHPLRSLVHRRGCGRMPCLPGQGHP